MKVFKNILWQAYEISQEFKNEAEFQTYIWRYCEQEWYVYYKLSDYDNMSLKPCDCFVCDTNWDTAWMELKYTKWDTININKLEPQQKAYLKRVHELWWFAVMVIYSLKRKAFVECDIEQFLNHANNDWTVNLFWEKLKDINRKKKIWKKFEKEKVKNNIPL